MEHFLWAFSLTLLAGLATGIGSAMILLTKQTNKKFLAFALGLSAGVMLYVSFVEILRKAMDALSAIHGEQRGTVYAVIGFFSGIAIIAVIDKYIPSESNPHEYHTGGNQKVSNEKQDLMRMGLFTAFAIGLHNFPEGLATFLAALEDPTTGAAITVAIAIHNIPEGIAVAVPIYYATGSKGKAFRLSLLSGLSEPIGAVVGYFLFIQFIGEEAFGFIFAAVAGIMVYISLDELLPTAEEYGEHQLAMWGVVLGMVVMAGSLLLFL